MEEKKPVEEKLPAEVRANMLSNETSIFFNVALFEQAQRIAHMFAGSSLVPTHFRGNVGNCMIGLNYAARLKADPFMVLQSLYIVHGRPGIEGKLVQAVINQSEKYSEPLQYEWLDPEDKSVKKQVVLKAQVPSEYGCQAFTVEKKSGKRVDGPKITWAIVKAEGWYDKNGPDGSVESNKWRTMPEMMFYYRAASWFGNKNCPELKLGMHTVEELEDIVDLREKANGTFGLAAPASDLNQKLKEAKPTTGEDIYKTEEVKPKEDPIRADYINLRNTGFKPWVMLHLERIPTMPEHNQIEIREKWCSAQFYPNEPYPLDTKEVDKRNELPDESSDDDLEPPPIGEKKPPEKKDPENLITIHCVFPDISTQNEPRNEPNRVYATYCKDQCKAHCTNYMNYRRNIESAGIKENNTK